MLKIYQEFVKIVDSGYMKEFWHEDFVFIILFIYLMLNNYFLILVCFGPLDIV